MNKERFNEINQMSEEEKTNLSKEELEQYYDYMANSTDTSISIPTEVYVEAGAKLGNAVLQSGVDTSLKAVKEGTIKATGKVAVFAELAINIYDMSKGTFNWNLENTLNLVSTTLVCLAVLGINIACLGAIATVLSSNPFTFGLALIAMVINYFKIGDTLDELKKMYMTCFNSYRRIYKLSNWMQTNDIIYNNLNKVLEYEKEQISKIRDEFIESEYYDVNMRRKIFIGADFNSFVLFNNIITFIQANQELSTARDGMYNDYIDFCSVIDYIDTHKILEKDLARIESFILNNDLKSLKDFVISMDFLTGYFETYKISPLLTQQTKNDIDYVLSCIQKIKDIIGINGLNDLLSENKEYKNNKNPQELFNSIYSYLIYSNAMQNSPYKVSASLLNPQYYSTQNIYEYVSGFSEYPVYLFSNWYFYFGNIMFNNIYIGKYQTELINSYNKNPQLYNKNLAIDFINDIDKYNDYTIKFIWLYSIREFLNNLYNYDYWNYSPYFATSISQVSKDEQGKTKYNYYLPNNQYAIPEPITVIKNFVKYFNENGYQTEKFNSLLKDIESLNFEKIFDIEFISLECTDSLLSGKFDNGSILGKFNKIDNSIYDLFIKLNSYVPNIFGTNMKNNYSQFKSLFETYLQNNNRFFINGAGIRSVRDDGKFAFGNKDKFNLNDLDFYGLSENITDFYLRILIKTRNIKYLIAYLVLITDGRWSGMWSGALFEFAYILTKSTKLRDMFFDGYKFKLGTKEEYIKSLWQFVRGEREDIIFYKGDIGWNYIDMNKIVNNMIDNSDYKKQIINLYNTFKNTYNNYRQQIKNDINLVSNMISVANDGFFKIKTKYPGFDSALEFSYENKYDNYLWNLFKMALSLGTNNYSYLDNLYENKGKFLVPVYKLENGFIELETYYCPFFILLSAKDDTDISQAYYLYNKDALNSLFSIGDEKFNEKIKEYSDLVSLTIQPETVEINHNEIIKNITENMKAMFELSEEKMFDLIGSQEDEYIMIQNLLNQDLLEKAVRDNEIQTENIIDVQEILDTNKELSDKTKKEINQTKLVLDKKDIIKYAIGAGLVLILLNRGKK